jgi:enamine deaminase RidA (YjgF/YER057c/UK114 family)
VHIAGQTATDAAGNLVGKGDIVAQAEQVMQNIGKALASVGATYRNLVDITIYITDPRYREAVGAARTKYCSGNLPASTLLVVAGLALPEYLVEIAATAVLD